MLIFLCAVLGIVGATHFSVNDPVIHKKILPMIWTIAVSGLVCLLWLYLVLRKQTRRLNYLKSVALEIGSGNLVGPAPMGKADEIGGVFNAVQIMRNHLLEVAFQMNQSTKTLNQAATEMLKASKTTSDGAVSQSNSSASMAAALEELSASIEEIGESVFMSSVASLKFIPAKINVLLIGVWLMASAKY